MPMPRPRTPSGPGGGPAARPQLAHGDGLPAARPGPLHRARAAADAVRAVRRLLPLGRLRDARGLRRCRQLHRPLRQPGLPGRPVALPRPGRPHARAPAAVRARHGGPAQPAAARPGRLPDAVLRALRAVRGHHRRALQHGVRPGRRTGRPSPRQHRPRQPRRRVVRRSVVCDGDPVHRHDLEVLRLPHDAPAGRTPVRPPGADRGGADRRCGRLAALPQRHPAAARAHHPHQHLPGRHRLDPALRPGVGDHPGRPRPPLRDHGRDHVPVRLQALPGRLRQRDQRGHVRDLPRLRPRLPAVRAAPRPRRGHHHDEGAGK